jgi:hypothetical protein
MARNHDGERISSVRRADGASGPRIAELCGKLHIAARLTEWDGEQGFPNIVLKTRASHVESDGELFAVSGEVFAKLPLGFDKNRMAMVFDEFAQTDPAGRIVFPEDGDQAFVSCDEFELPDWGLHDFVSETHGVSFAISD